jgi:hypothetical protein
LRRLPFAVAQALPSAAPAAALAAALAAADRRGSFRVPSPATSSPSPQSSPASATAPFSSSAAASFSAGSAPRLPLSLAASGLVAGIASSGSGARPGTVSGVRGKR